MQRSVVLLKVCVWFFYHPFTFCCWSFFFFVSFVHIFFFFKFNMLIHYSELSMSRPTLACQPSRDVARLHTKLYSLELAFWKMHFIEISSIFEQFLLKCCMDIFYQTGHSHVLLAKFKRMQPKHIVRCSKSCSFNYVRTTA